MKQIDPTFALVVLSGGQDSTTCLGYALDRYLRVATITFDYGQRHRAEIDAAHKVRTFFEDAYDRAIPYEIVRLGPDTFRGTSPLTAGDQKLETYANHAEMEAIIGDRVEKTFVPMRNAAFLVYAANRAVCMGAGTIITGVCEADNANYPDCREVFIRSMQDTINLALGFSRPVNNGAGIYIQTPLMHLSKAESIKLAQKLPYTYDALAWSHTAYDGQYPPVGKDHASVLRAHGFEQAGVPDPLVLRAWREGLMDLPDTANYSSVKGNR